MKAWSDQHEADASAESGPRSKIKIDKSRDPRAREALPIVNSCSNADAPSQNLCCFGFYDVKADRDAAGREDAGSAALL